MKMRGVEPAGLAAVLLASLGGGRHVGCQSLNTPIYFNGDPARWRMGSEDPPRLERHHAVLPQPDRSRSRRTSTPQTTAADYGGDVPWSRATRSTSSCPSS